MSSPNPFYVCVRRKHQSFFIMCTPTQTVLYIKQQVAQCLNNTTTTDISASHHRGHAEDKTITVVVDDPSTLRLLDEGGTILNDTDSVQALKNDDTLYVCLPISTTDGEWEPVDVISTSTSDDKTSGSASAAAAAAMKE